MQIDFFIKGTISIVIHCICTLPKSTQFLKAVKVWRRAISFQEPIAPQNVFTHFVDVYAGSSFFW